jgi:hypothetical protein
MSSSICSIAWSNTEIRIGSSGGLTMTSATYY